MLSLLSGSGVLAMSGETGGLPDERERCWQSRTYSDWEYLGAQTIRHKRRGNMCHMTTKRGESFADTHWPRYNVQISCPNGGILKCIRGNYLHLPPYFQSRIVKTFRLKGN